MKAMLVTTEHRGVFFGYSDADPEKVIETKRVNLSNARNCISWSGIKGFLALAERGPSDNCRIGPAVSSFYVNDITSVAICTDEAVEKWEKAPW